MHPEVESRRDELVNLCERFKVKTLEVFGSAATDEFDSEKSDVDFLVSFLELGPGEHADSYFGLLEQLESLFERHIDLVVTSAVKNLYFLDEIEKTRTLLYAA